MGEFCLKNLHLRRGICSNVRQLYKDIEEDVRFPAGLRYPRKQKELVVLASFDVLRWYVLFDVVYNDCRRLVSVLPVLCPLQDLLSSVQGNCDRL